MTIIGESKYWDMLWEKYKQAPSIALCRVPELEYASTPDVTVPTLDQCCGKAPGNALMGNRTR